jgi:hypothetical protein
MQGVDAMSTRQSFSSRVHYGRQLVKSGVQGLSSGRQEHLQGRPFGDVLTQSARASLGLATVGACVGLLRYFLPARKHRTAQTVACGLLGGTVGFLAGFGWKTRDLTESMTRSAARQISVARDQRWLERHPIDYA